MLALEKTCRELLKNLKIIYGTHWCRLASQVLSLFYKVPFLANSASSTQCAPQVFGSFFKVDFFLALQAFMAPQVFSIITYVKIVLLGFHTLD